MKSPLEPAKVLAGAIVFVFEQQRELARALALPFVLYCAADFAHLLVNNPWSGFVVLFATLAVHTVFAVTTHRMILLGPASVPRWGLRAWTKRESFFAVHVILVGLCTFPAFAFGLIPGVGVVIAFVVALWIMSRLSLVFPAIAIDQALTVTLAWQMSAKHQLPLFVCAGLFPVLLAIPVGFFSLSESPYISVAGSILNTVMTVFTFAALSLAYREIYRLEYGGGAS